MQTYLLLNYANLQKSYFSFSIPFNIAILRIHIHWYVDLDVDHGYLKPKNCIFYSWEKKSKIEKYIHISFKAFQAPGKASGHIQLFRT
jgi:hypothetical protein